MDIVSELRKAKPLIESARSSAEARQGGAVRDCLVPYVFARCIEEGGSYWTGQAAGVRQKSFWDEFLAKILGTPQLSGIAAMPPGEHTGRGETFKRLLGSYLSIKPTKVYRLTTLSPGGRHLKVGVVWNSLIGVNVAIALARTGRYDRVLFLSRPMTDFQYIVLVGEASTQHPSSILPDLQTWARVAPKVAGWQAGISPRRTTSLVEFIGRGRRPEDNAYLLLTGFGPPALFTMLGKTDLWPLLGNSSYYNWAAFPGAGLPSFLPPASQIQRYGIAGSAKGGHTVTMWGCPAASPWIYKILGIYASGKIKEGYNPPKKPVAPPTIPPGTPPTTPPATTMPTTPAEEIAASTPATPTTPAEEIAASTPATPTTPPGTPPTTPTTTPTMPTTTPLSLADIGLEPTAHFPWVGVALGMLAILGGGYLLIKGRK